MEMTGFTKQIIDFQKTSFNQTYAGVTALQDYSETVMDTIVSQTPWINEESMKPVNDSIKIMKSAREEYKKAVDQGFIELEKLVVSSNS
ncbi:MAG: hypothetical protein GY702_12115 [Desulfobulbaceae bacterium]|nr:hypothetical protein [Desulfobulbaceae bacterium]